MERIDTTRRLASTSRGDFVWDALVLATGARARRPAAFGGSGVHVLRTLDDARRLRAELVPGRRLAIVGSGFVGTEVASTAVELGVDVTIIDLASLPFERTLGPEVGRLLADRYREHGVDLRLGAGVERVLRRSDGTLRGLRLSNGTELECDLVLVAVGAEPAGELLLGAPGPIETDEGGRTVTPERLRLWRRRCPVERRAFAPCPSRTLDERGRAGGRGRPRHPRQRAGGQADALLLVRPVRSPASARRLRGGMGANRPRRR